VATASSEVGRVAWEVANTSLADQVALAAASWASRAA